MSSPDPILTAPRIRTRVAIPRPPRPSFPGDLVTGILSEDERASTLSRNSPRQPASSTPQPALRPLLAPSHCPPRIRAAHPTPGDEGETNLATCGSAHQPPPRRSPPPRSTPPSPPSKPPATRPSTPPTTSAAPGSPARGLPRWGWKPPSPTPSAQNKLPAPRPRLHTRYRRRKWQYLAQPRSRILKSFWFPVVLFSATRHRPAQTAPPAPASAQEPPVTTLKVATGSSPSPRSHATRPARPSTGLTRDDFLLKQDGKPQPIRYFSQGSSLPLTLALMVDTSGSQRDYIQDECNAGRVFFRAMMAQPRRPRRPRPVRQLHPPTRQVTNSVTTLEHALAYLYSVPRRHRSLLGAEARCSYDAICAVSHIELGNQIGRRAMVILTDGGDNGSRSTRRRPSKRPSVPTS